MGKLENLTVPLTDDLATAIQAAVDSGGYPVAEMVRIVHATRDLASLSLARDPDDS